MYKTQFLVGGLRSYGRDLQVMAGFPSYGREFYTGDSRPGIAFLGGSNIMG